MAHPLYYMNYKNKFGDWEGRWLKRQYAFYLIKKKHNLGEADCKIIEQHGLSSLSEQISFEAKGDSFILLRNFSSHYLTRKHFKRI